MEAVSRRKSGAKATVVPVRYGRNNLAGPKKLGRSQRKEVAYVDAMLSHL